MAVRQEDEFLWRLRQMITKDRPWPLVAPYHQISEQAMELAVLAFDLWRKVRILEQLDIDEKRRDQGHP